MLPACLLIDQSFIHRKVRSFGRSTEIFWDRKNLKNIHCKLYGNENFCDRINRNFLRSKKNIENLMKTEIFEIGFSKFVFEDSRKKWDLKNVVTFRLLNRFSTGWKFFPSQITWRTRWWHLYRSEVAQQKKCACRHLQTKYAIRKVCPQIDVLGIRI